MEGKELLAHLADLKDNLQKYLETKVSFYGIVAFEKAVKVLGLFISQAFFAMAGFMVLLFLSGAAAMYIGGLLQSYVLGMAIVGGGYLLILLVFYLGRNRIFGRMAIRILLNIFIRDDEDSK